jgi:hypothetical protein
MGTHGKGEIPKKMWLQNLWFHCCTQILTQTYWSRSHTLGCINPTCSQKLLQFCKAQDTDIFITLRLQEDGQVAGTLLGCNILFLSPHLIFSRSTTSQTSIASCPVTMHTDCSYQPVILHQLNTICYLGEFMSTHKS